MPKRKQSDLSERGVSSSSKEKKGPSEGEWSKSKKKRMRRLKAKQKKKDFPDKSTNHDSSAMEMFSNKPKGVKTDSSAIETPYNEPKGVKTSSALQQSFMARLTGSRFRELNEVRSLPGSKQVSIQSIAISFAHNYINISLCCTGTVHNDIFFFIRAVLF